MNPRREGATIVLSMVVTCAIGAAILGGLYVVTSRHAEAQRRATEIREVTGLLGLEPGARVLEIRLFLDVTRAQVVYRVAPLTGTGAPVERRFGLDGAPMTRAAAADPATAEPDPLLPLGRMFVALRGGAAAGFVVEGDTRGYKNRIRFLVGLDDRFTITGVRVVEHEEDPGLGAEIASLEFESQFVGRAPGERSLAVTRDVMPEDWRAALSELRRTSAAPWRARHRALIERERSKPVYAVTGATISSRALADGVRITVERFRSRWERIAPHLPTDGSL